MVSLFKPQRRPLLQSNRIEILGAFGAGKTTLANSLAMLCHPVLESHEAIPFWGNQVLQASMGYLPYDVAFLLHHIELLAKASFEERSLLICDWSFVTDNLWASFRLDDQYPSYGRLHRALTKAIEPPKAYLYLNYPPNLVLERIRSRSRPEEADFGLDNISRAINGLSTIALSLKTPVIDISPQTPLSTILKNLEQI